MRVVNLDNAEADGLKAYTTLEVLEMIGVERPTNPQTKECAGILRTYLGDSKRIQGRDKWRVPFHLNQRGDQVVVPDDPSEYE